MKGGDESPPPILQRPPCPVLCMERKDKSAQSSRDLQISLHVASGCFWRYCVLQMQRCILESSRSGRSSGRFPIIRNRFLTPHQTNTEGMLTRVLWLPAHVGGGGNEVLDFCGKTDGKWQPAQLKVTSGNQRVADEQDCCRVLVSAGNNGRQERCKSPHTQ